MTLPMQQVHRLMKDRKARARELREFERKERRLQEKLRQARPTAEPGIRRLIQAAEHSAVQTQAEIDRIDAQLRQSW